MLGLHGSGELFHNSWTSHNKPGGLHCPIDHSSYWGVNWEGCTACSNNEVVASVTNSEHCEHELMMHQGICEYKLMMHQGICEYKLMMRQGICEDKLLMHL